MLRHRLSVRWRETSKNCDLCRSDHLQPSMDHHLSHKRLLVLNMTCSPMKIFTEMLAIDNFPINTIKGKICTQTIIHEFEQGNINIDLSIKPKCAMFGLGNVSISCHTFLQNIFRFIGFNSQHLLHRVSHDGW